MLTPENPYKDFISCSSRSNCSDNPLQLNLSPFHHASFIVS